MRIAWARGERMVDPCLDHRRVAAPRRRVERRDLILPRRVDSRAAREQRFGGRNMAVVRGDDERCEPAEEGPWRRYA